MAGDEDSALMNRNDVFVNSLVLPRSFCIGLSLAAPP